MSSARYICGTQDIHKKLELQISKFHGTEDAIAYTTCYGANTGLFESILGPDDAVISDALNHASIIDGVRLCKARRYLFKHNDMKDLEDTLVKCKDIKGIKMIVTDGVFSMDGDFANLPKICELAKLHEAVLVVDDSHATGFIGEHGRGSLEHFGVEDKVDIVTSPLSKALGGSAGGYTTGPAEVVELLRQKSRPYLFSNSLPPVIVAMAMKAIDLVQSEPFLRSRLQENTFLFRSEMKKRGFRILGNGDHPISPVLIGDALIASKIAEEMRNRGIFVIACSYPVVAQNMARIRVQISAAHTRKQIEVAIECFTEIGRKYNVL